MLHVRLCIVRPDIIESDLIKITVHVVYSLRCFVKIQVALVNLILTAVIFGAPFGSSFWITVQRNPTRVTKLRIRVMACSGSVVDHTRARLTVVKRYTD